MFDQATLDNARPAGNPWAISASVALQACFIATAVLLPLLHIEPLPPVQLTVPTMAPRHVKLVEIPPSLREALRSVAPALSSPLVRRVLTVPTRIPDKAELIIDPGVLIDANAAAPQQPMTGIVPGILDRGPIVAEPPKPPAATAARPSPTAIVENKTYRIGGDVRSPVLRSAPRPPYPPLAKAARIQGTVRLNGIVSRDGTVKSLELASGHPLLVQAALQAVRTWLYEPARLNGQPVDVILIIDVNFTLSQ